MIVTDTGNHFLGEDPIPLQPLNLGFTYYFLSKEQFDCLNSKIMLLGSKATVVTFNGDDGYCNFIHQSDSNNIYALDFYGGNETKPKGISLKDLRENVKNNEFSRLGYLRMDVDDLGSIFQKGLGKKSTLARYSALSRVFDYFFSGYLNTIWAESDSEGNSPKESYHGEQSKETYHGELCKDTIIVYSGGDDVFAIGEWEAVISLAKRIRECFTSFTCKLAEHYSISGGISIVTPKFPITSATQNLSAKEEKNAKQHKAGDKEKDSISFLNMPMNWDKEFKMIEKCKGVIVDLVEAKQLPHAFIQKLLNHYLNALGNEDKLKEHKISKPKTYWMLVYDFGRLKQRIKSNDKDARDMIDNCINEICKTSKVFNGKTIVSDYHAIELWAMACRWEELELRK